jgi:hypothetical protein
MLLHITSCRISSQRPATQSLRSIEQYDGGTKMVVRGSEAVKVEETAVEKEERGISSGEDAADLYGIGRGGPRSE